MSIEVEVLAETYAILKQYIPSKDRQEAADNLISILVDMLSDSDLAELAASDNGLQRSAKEYMIEDEDTDDYSEE